MAAEGEKSKDFYEVLGLKKECTAAELRNAYKKLAMKWHPDRCSGNMKQMEEAKKKFQSIQEAYSVLSDPNKRFLYDVGVYDCEDEEDENGMGDFLNEMAGMMCQNNSNENGEQSFEELQELFHDLFQSDVDASSWNSGSSSNLSYSSFMPQSNEPYGGAKNKRCSSQMSPNAPKFETNQFEGFHIGVGFPESTRTRQGLEAKTEGRRGWSRRNGRKQKVSFCHDVSSNDSSTSCGS